MSDNERVAAMRWLLQKAAKKYQKPGILDMPLNLEDRGNENKAIKQYSMCYPAGDYFLKNLVGPDWTFVNWPSANITNFKYSRMLIIANSYIPPRSNKIFWAGNINSPLADVIESKTRPKLLSFGNANHHDFDIRHIGPENGQIPKSDLNYLSINKITLYSYLLDIGGNGYSGRLKYLMFSRRPILIVERKYVEYFYEDLVPFEHFIPVKEDLSDLLEMSQWLKKHEEEAKEIATNMFNYAIKNFTNSKLLERVNFVYENNFV
jgi:hypothetical protein